MEQDSIYRVVVLEKDNAAKNEQIIALQAENLAMKERLDAIDEYELTPINLLKAEMFDVQDKNKTLQAENERLKARAEALERAIKECKVKDECDLKCHMCVNEGCEGYYDRDGDDRWIDGECDWCENRSKWQFDEARFTGGEKE